MVFLGSPRFFSPLFSSTLDLTRWELATLRWREHSVRLEPCKSGIYYSHVSQTVNGSSKHQKARSTASGRVARFVRTRFFFRASFSFLHQQEERVIEVDRPPPPKPTVSSTFSPDYSANELREPSLSRKMTRFPLIEKVEPCAQFPLQSIVVVRRSTQTRVFSGARSRGSIFDHGRFLTIFSLRYDVRLVYVSTNNRYGYRRVLISMVPHSSSACRA